jgi:hypothetical protein
MYAPYLLALGGFLAEKNPEFDSLTYMVSLFSKDSSLFAFTLRIACLDLTTLTFFFRMTARRCVCQRQDRQLPQGCFNIGNCHKPPRALHASRLHTPSTSLPSSTLASDVLTLFFAQLQPRIQYFCLSSDRAVQKLARSEIH